MSAPVPEEVKALRAAARAGGRPPKLDRELMELITNALRRGHYLETAAALAGVNSETLRSWLREGARAKSGIKKQFSTMIKQAMAEAEDRDLRVIDKAADGWDKVSQHAVQRRNPKTNTMEVIEQTVDRSTEFSWTAAAWRLERKYPSKWGRRDHMEVTGSEEKPIVFKQDETGETQGKKLAALLLALAEVKLLPEALIQAIDVTPGQNGSNGNGANGTGAE